MMSIRDSGERLKAIGRSIKWRDVAEHVFGASIALISGMVTASYALGGVEAKTQAVDTALVVHAEVSDKRMSRIEDERKDARADAEKLRDLLEEVRRAAAVMAEQTEQLRKQLERIEDERRRDHQRHRR